MSENHPTVSATTAYGKFRMQPFRLMRIDWLSRAALLPGRTLHYAIALYILASIRNSATVTISRNMLARYGVTRDAAGDALGRLVEAGLVEAERGRGREPCITLLDNTGKVLILKSLDISD